MTIDHCVKNWSMWENFFTVMKIYNYYEKSLLSQWTFYCDKTFWLWWKFITEIEISHYEKLSMCPKL